MTPAHDFWLLWLITLVVLFVSLFHILGEEAGGGRLHRMAFLVAYGIALAFALPPLWRLLVLVWQG